MKIKDILVENESIEYEAVQTIRHSRHYSAMGNVLAKLPKQSIFNVIVEMLKQSRSEPETTEIVELIPEEYYSTELIEYILSNMDGSTEGNLYRFFPKQYLTGDILKIALKNANPNHSEYYSLSDSFGYSLRNGKISRDMLKDLDVVNMLKTIFSSEEAVSPSEFQPAESLMLLKKNTSPDVWNRVERMINPYDN